RFQEDDDRLTRILKTPINGVDDLQTVAWAVDRKDGGRGFGFTGGHFSHNLFLPGYRTLLLNAIVWTAGMEVPEGGVQVQDPDPIKALIITGHNFPGHDWKGVTEALKSALAPDARFSVEVTEDIRDLADPKIHDYDVLLFNYVNWQRPGLPKEARENFKKYIEEGGGLVLIHFANGAFNYSLPDAVESDWEEYRTKIVRRAWIHGEGNSAHDPYGKFTCEIVEVDHPIIEGMNDFETEDELYYNQIGDLPIEPLVTALSKNTGKQEPLAFAYDYGNGRIFQTFLGHAPISVSAEGPAELIRRGTVWAAERGQMEFSIGNRD
ncbi:MAG: ThuA domain-containing protein, partial [Candidatus Omnitrophica bacterium]|nr:ThuA domain-containing protein [Candidatus Omnitrophota bacterium]